MYGDFIESGDHCPQPSVTTCAVNSAAPSPVINSTRPSSVYNSVIVMHCEKLNNSSNFYTTVQVKVHIMGDPSEFCNIISFLKLLKEF